MKNPTKSIENDLTEALGIPLKQLWWLASTTKTLYTRKLQAKRSGGFRNIDKPTPLLKKVQRGIYYNILLNYPLPETMCGGAVGKSIIDNVKKHIGKKCVITLDIKDFYPSIKYPFVLQIFKKKLHLDETSARLLAKLCIYKYSLPQGAPTSPMLSNLYILDAHNEIQVLARKHSLDVTFFIDDIAISGDNPRVIIDEIVTILRKYKLKLKQMKKRIMPHSSSQIVTGIQIGEELKITEEKMNEFYEEIVEVLASKNAEHIRNVISGITGFVSMVNKEQADQINDFIKNLKLETK